MKCIKYLITREELFEISEAANDGDDSKLREFMELKEPVNLIHIGSGIKLYLEEE